MSHTSFPSIRLFTWLSSLPSRGYVTENAGEIWYAASVLAGLLLYGLAVFFFIFGILPYWYKLHKNLNEILGCESTLSLGDSG